MRFPVCLSPVDSSSFSLSIVSADTVFNRSLVRKFEEREVARAAVCLRFLHKDAAYTPARIQHCCEMCANGPDNVGRALQ